jgi:hypothetical protein
MAGNTTSLIYVNSDYAGDDSSQPEANDPAADSPAMRTMANLANSPAMRAVAEAAATWQRCATSTPAGTAGPYDIKFPL